MTTSSVSVVVVSRHRPEELRKCLLALTFQTLPIFEVIIVGDPGVADVVAQLDRPIAVQQSLFDEANISKARNIGIAMAAGDVVAFIDDDAVAEPTWLERLIAPFSDTEVAAVGGFVRGRNGISYQWKAEAIGRTGDSEPFEVHQTTILEGTEYRAIKTQGTNCAFRRDVLIELGGFDENYHFYMDETDLNMRLAYAGKMTAIVPDAEVQHGYAESARRTRNRAPRTLYDIGASRAYFLKKHGQDLAKLDVARDHQRVRLLRHMVYGEIEPKDVARLLQTFDEGVENGLKRESITPQFDEPGAFQNFRTLGDGDHQVFFGRRRNKAKLFESAQSHSGGATAMVFSRTGLFHRRWFHRDGFWVQSGGLYGKSDRSDKLLARYTTRARAERECAALEKTRPMADKPKRQ